MLWFTKKKEQMDELHYQYVAIMIRTFKTFIEVFKRTAPGVRYYVNCTEEQDAQTHKETAADILHTLETIKSSDIAAYKVLCLLYEDDIRDVKMALE